MKLLINTSTLSASGVTQVSTSFIEECKKFTENTYMVFLSKTVAAQFDYTRYPENFVFHVIQKHPLYGLKGFCEMRKMKRLSKEFQPDAVFSVFGPSCWTPKFPHLQGYAYPHFVYPDSPLFSKLTVPQKIRIWLRKKLQLYFINRNGSNFVSETADVSNKLKKLLPDPKNKFYTVSNTCNAFFSNFAKENGTVIDEGILPARLDKEFRFLSLCTFHQHKNLEILNEVIPILNRELPNNKIRFVLTVDKEGHDKKFTEEAKKSIMNVERQPVDRCAQLYAENDALFLPTLLECFSANYPEAMFMKKPIVTSNLSFATSVCEDAAIYFDPINAEDIAEQLLRLYHSQDLRHQLVENGTERLKNFPSATERAQKYLEICESIRK